MSLDQATAPERDTQPIPRSLPIGAEPVSEGGVHFRLWAPRRRHVEVVFEGATTGSLPLAPEPNGYFSGRAERARPGSLYRFRLDDSQTLYPDPGSRFQPQGPHGPSQVIDPSRFRWTDQDWKGITPANQVLYEMHIGTFTPEGTWAAAIDQLPALVDLGATCLEVMPVNEFPGRFGWGYDGVDLFAPFHHYGSPDDFRQFVNRAHALGLAVILDVVYNHLGPDGNYLREFSEDYFSHKHETDWGDALNFDGKNSAGVREFFLANAAHWIREYHLDGFRFDATQAIVDDSKSHILAEISRSAREAAGDRGIYLINENEPQNTTLVRPPDRGGMGMDALWNDDFHHSAMVALSGRSEAYYADFAGRSQEFISAAKWGYLYQGQRFKWQKQRRGTPALDLPPTAFVHFIQNHDQVANSARGQRAHQLSSPAQYRAMTALLLLMPQTPLLFQGQEWAASSTFHYFADHHPELAKLVRAGRAKELSQFPTIASPQTLASLLDPDAEDTFLRSKLRPDERDLPGHREIYRMHKDLLRLRREDPAFRRVQCRGDIDGAVLGPDAFLLRFFTAAHAEDRLLVVNFGSDLPLDIAPEPLLAPVPDHRWSILWSSEDPHYGGSGTPPLDTEQEGWLLPARCATVLRLVPFQEGAVHSRHRVKATFQAPRKKDEED
jgi:maltooligosyltrehalose trehalohydrolase